MRKLLNKPWFVALLAIGALAAVAWQVMPRRFHSDVAAAPAAEAPADDGTSDSTVSGPTNSPERIFVALKEIASMRPVRDPFAGRSRVTAAQAVEKAEPDIVESVHDSACC